MNDDAAGIVAGILIAGENQRQNNEKLYQQQAETSRIQNDLDSEREKAKAQQKKAAALADDISDLEDQNAQLMQQARQRIAGEELERAYNIVWQKAFWELAYRLGEKLGMARDEVFDTAAKLKYDVLDRKFDAARPTNAAAFELKYADALRQRFLKEDNAFKDAYEQFVKEGRLYGLFEQLPKNWNKAFETWLAMAKDGNGEAQYNVGRCYDRGEGVKQDYGCALEWYAKALERNAILAAHNLFLLYKNPKFAGYDLDLARRYAARAIALGDPRTAGVLAQFEKDELQALYKREERPLLDQLLSVDPERPPTELLDKIKGRGYRWADAITALHSCRYALQTHNVKNEGSFFKPDKRGDVYLELDNPTTFSAYVRFAGKSFSETIKAEGRTSTCLGRFPVGQRLEEFSLTMHAMSFTDEDTVKVKIPGGYVV